MCDEHQRCPHCDDELVARLDAIAAHIAAAVVESRRLELAEMVELVRLVDAAASWVATRRHIVEP